MTDLAAIVDAVTDHEEFDVLDFFSGAVLPTDSVTLYRDADAGFKLAALLDKEAEIAKTKKKENDLSLGDEDGYIDEDLVNELHERLLASAVTFNLQAVEPEEQKLLRSELRAKHKYREGKDNEDYNMEYNYTMIAKTIQSVKAASGAVDTKEWTAERVEAFDRKVLSTEFERLFNAVFELNFIGDAIDRAVNADF